MEALLIQRLYVTLPLENSKAPSELYSSEIPQPCITVSKHSTNVLPNTIRSLNVVIQIRGIGIAKSVDRRSRRLGGLAIRFEFLTRLYKLATIRRQHRFIVCLQDERIKLAATVELQHVALVALVGAWVRKYPAQRLFTNSEYPLVAKQRNNWNLAFEILLSTLTEHLRSLHAPTLG